MNQIDKITSEIIKFRDERDWEQFHNGKDLSLALFIEAAELNQLFLWKKPEDVNVEKLTTSGNLSQIMFDSLHNTAIANDVVRN